MRVWGIGLGVLLIGCDGSLTEPPPPPPPPPPVPCTGLNVGTGSLARLTRAEYVHSVRDLLRYAGSATDNLPSDEPTTEPPGRSKFTANVFSSISEDGLWKLMETAEAITDAIAPSILTRAPCPSGSDEACATAFIASFGRRAYRRPLTAAETQGLLTVFRAGRTGSTYEHGVRLTMQAMLQSPHFLYHLELGEEAVARPGTNIRPLTPFELASRMSFFLWQAVPDEALLDAAAGGQLATDAQIEAQARRLLDDDRAREPIRAFVAELVNARGGLDARARDELSRFIDDAVWMKSGRLSTLFTSRTAFLDGPMREAYGISDLSEPTRYKAFELPAGQRAGLLTRVGFLAAAKTPTVRGKAIRNDLLCATIRLPEGVDAVIKATSGSERQRLSAHGASACAAGCHNLMDPIGLALGNYDKEGRWRDEDQYGFAVDPAGDLVDSGSVSGTFTGGVQLSNLLARSEVARSCVARQWFAFAARRNVDEVADACSIQAMDAAFAASDGKIVELLVATTKTDAFRFLQAERP